MHQSLRKGLELVAAKDTYQRLQKLIEAVLSEASLVMPLPVVFEILSGVGLSQNVRELILQLPKLEMVLYF